MPAFHFMQKLTPNLLSYKVYTLYENIIPVPTHNLGKPTPTQCQQQYPAGVQA